jgi:putative membrane protein
MIVRKNLKWSIIFKTTRRALALWLVVSCFAYFLFFTLGIREAALPFAPVAVLGTALSIFLGLRNSSSYDRWWEARKAWGGIVNMSRTFARQVITLSEPETNRPADIGNVHRDLIYRHLAWMNALRLQLRLQTAVQTWESDVKKFLPDEERRVLDSARNKATQLLLAQGLRASDYKRRGIYDDFRHMQLDNSLSELYNLQGTCERIKNTPLPRQYDFFNYLFMHIFVFLVPFSLLEIFEKTPMPYLLIPFSVMIGFVFFIVEGVGRRIEDPFENKITDTPMTALCRTIEIDLRQMLGEEELPPKLEPVDGFLF